MQAIERETFFEMCRSSSGKPNFLDRRPDLLHALTGQLSDASPKQKLITAFALRCPVPRPVLSVNLTDLGPISRQHSGS